MSDNGKFEAQEVRPRSIAPVDAVRKKKEQRTRARLRWIMAALCTVAIWSLTDSTGGTPSLQLIQAISATPDEAFEDIPPTLISTPDLLPTTTAESSPTPTPPLTHTETPTPTPEISPYEQENILQPDNGELVGVGPRTFEQHQDESGKMYIIVTANRKEEAEIAGKIQVLDQQAKDDSNKERIMVGIDLGDGRYLYNIPLDENNVSLIHILDRARDTHKNRTIVDSKGKSVPLFQYLKTLQGKRYTSFRDDNETLQGSYFAIQSFFDKINATPTPTRTSKNPRDQLAAIRNRDRLPWQRS